MECRYALTELELLPESLKYKISKMNYDVSETSNKCRHVTLLKVFFKPIQFFIFSFFEVCVFSHYVLSLLVMKVMIIMVFLFVLFCFFNTHIVPTMSLLGVCKRDVALVCLPCSNICVVKKSYL